MSSQDYAEMIEIPVSSCEIVDLSESKAKSSQKRYFSKISHKKLLGFFRSKQKNKHTVEEKEAVLSDSASNPEEAEPEENNLSAAENNVSDVTFTQTSCEDENENEVITCDKKPRFKWNLVTAQVITVFVLAIGLLITNIFWKDSGINNLFRSVFSPQVSTADERSYEVFDAFSPSKNSANVENGIITVEVPGAIYSPAKGKITSVRETDGKYTFTIEHSTLFKTVVSGADYFYGAEGETVFTSTPVCYSKNGGVQIAMYNDNSLITGYTLADGKIVWQS